MPKFFDAFSGVGGFRYGFEREGFECVGYSEIDKHAVKLYSELFRDDRNYGDITQIDPESLPDFDVITGGIPCQPFSVAGKRKGLEDPRGMPLWRAFFNIVRVKEPKVVVIENVKGLLSSNGGRDFAWVLVQMAELGYTVEWAVLNSKDFGVPQNRERVFIVGYTGGGRPPKVFPLREGEIAAYTPPPRDAPKLQTSADIATAVTTRYGQRPVDTYLVMLSNTGGNIKQRVQRRDTTWTLDTSGNKMALLLEGGDVRKLTPLECFRLQGFPDEVAETARRIGISDTQLYKMAGNAVTVSVVQSLARKIRRAFFE